MKHKYTNTYDFFICSFFKNPLLVSLSDYNYSERKELVELILSEADEEVIEWYFNYSRSLFDFNRIFYMQALGMQKNNINSTLNSMVGSLFNLFTPIFNEIFQEAEIEYLSMQKEPKDNYDELRAANDLTRRVG